VFYQGDVQGKACGWKRRKSLGEIELSRGKNLLRMETGGWTREPVRHDREVKWPSKGVHLVKAGVQGPVGTFREWYEREALEDPAPWTF